MPQRLKQMTAELLSLTWDMKAKSHLLNFLLHLFFSPLPQPLIHNCRILKPQEMQFENHWDTAKELAL